MIPIAVICDAGTHCPTCRNLEGGRKWRESLSKAVEVTSVDFECSRGLAWGHDSAIPPTLGPGSLVSIVLSKLGYVAGPLCGCRAFADKMNAWGWWGCYRNRQEIVEWFTLKAREQNIEVDGVGVWSLVKTGIRDFNKSRV